MTTQSTETTRDESPAVVNPGSTPTEATPKRRVAKAGAAPKAKAPKAAAKKGAPSKADRVRALLDRGKTVLDISKALDDVTWAYAWDVAAAWEKKTGKTVIASHKKAKAPRARKATAKATVAH